MREYDIQSEFGLPTINAIISGPRGAKRINLIFDTGCALSQIHFGTLQSIGYAFRNRKPDLLLQGVKGPLEDGYSFSPTKFFVLQKMFTSPRLAAFDLNEWAGEGVDGFLGWDLIQKFHLELDGKHSKLKVYSG